MPNFLKCNLKGIRGDNVQSYAINDATSMLRIIASIFPGSFPDIYHSHSNTRLHLFEYIVKSLPCSLRGNNCKTSFAATNTYVKITIG